MSQLPEPIEQGQLRASDADRDRVADLLREAASDGRLNLDELDDRLAQVYASRTYGELEQLVRDLPVTGRAPSSIRPAADPAAPVSRGAFAVLGAFDRKGRWSVPRYFTCFMFWGGGSIDLREACFTTDRVTIRTVAIMGGMQIIVPEDANVYVTGIGVMGGFDHGPTGPGAPGAPTIVVSGVAFWGGVSIKRRPPVQEERRRKAERKRLKAEHRRALDER